MLTIRQKQLQVFEEMTMFEQRILCRQLSNSFYGDSIDTDAQQNANKFKKNVQEFKRRMLNAELEHYEKKIEKYEHLYQQELSAFQLEMDSTNSHQLCQSKILMRLVQDYLYYHTDIFIRRIRWKESGYHVKLMQRYHRQLSATRKNNIIDVYPQVIVDVDKVSLNRVQLDYLSRNGKLTILFEEEIFIGEFVIMS